MLAVCQTQRIWTQQQTESLFWRLNSFLPSTLSSSRPSPVSPSISLLLCNWKEFLIRFICFQHWPPDAQHPRPTMSLFNLPIPRAIHDRGRPGFNLNMSLVWLYVSFPFLSESVQLGRKFNFTNWTPLSSSTDLVPHLQLNLHPCTTRLTMTFIRSPHLLLLLGEFSNPLLASHSLRSLLLQTLFASDCVPYSDYWFIKLSSLSSSLSLSPSN